MFFLEGETLPDIGGSCMCRKRQGTVVRVQDEFEDLNMCGKRQQG